jgi:hypothetical protein
MTSLTGIRAGGALTLLLLAPSFVTNVWQGLVGGHLLSLINELLDLSKGEPILEAVCDALGKIDDPPSLHRYFYANANRTDRPQRPRNDSGPDRVPPDFT